MAGGARRAMAGVAATGEVSPAAAGWEGEAEVARAAGGTASGWEGEGQLGVVGRGEGEEATEGLGEAAPGCQWR